MSIKDFIQESSDTTDILENMSDSLISTTSKFVALEKVIPTVTDEIVEQGDALKKLSLELGNASKSSDQLVFEMRKLSMMTGLSSKSQVELLTATKQYHKELSSNVTKSTLQFTRITGVSTDVVGKFASTLEILGDISDETYKSLYEGILSVRDAYGLTNNEATLVINTLNSYASVIGLTNDNTKEITNNTAEFVSKLTAVGIESNKTSDILDSMINPEKLTDYVMLWTKMGYTMDDIASGSFGENLDEAIPKLKQVGEEIAETAKTNRIAASNQAKIYNLTLEQALRLSKLDISEQALNQQKTLESYRKEIATLKQSGESIINSLTGIGGVLLTPINFVFKTFSTVLPGVLGNTLGVFGSLLVARMENKLILKPLKFAASAAKKILLDPFINTAKKIIGAEIEPALAKAAKSFSEPIQELLGVSQERLSKKESDKGDILNTNASQIKRDVDESYDFMGSKWNRQNTRQVKRLNKIQNDIPDISDESQKSLVATNNYITRLEKAMSSMLDNVSGDFSKFTEKEKQAFNRISESYNVILKETTGFGSNFVLNKDAKGNLTGLNYDASTLLKGILSEDQYSLIDSISDINSLSSGFGSILGSQIGTNAQVNNLQKNINQRIDSEKKSNIERLQEIASLNHSINSLDSSSDKYDENSAKLKEQIESIQKLIDESDKTILNYEQLNEALNEQTKNVSVSKPFSAEEIKEKDVFKQKDFADFKSTAGKIFGVIGKTVGGVASVAGVGAMLYNKFADDKTKQAVNESINSIGTIFSDVFNQPAVKDLLTKQFPGFINSVSPIITQVANFLGKILGGTANFLGKILGGISSSSAITSKYTQKISNNYEDQLKEATLKNAGEMLQVLGKIAYNTGSTAQEIQNAATSQLGIG